MAKTKPISAMDRIFLLGETRESMMHVASLLPFSAPPGGASTLIRELMAEIHQHPDVVAPFNFKLRYPGWLAHPMQCWVEDPELDLDYHVRHVALPSPGGERELGVLVSRLHSQPIDFSRPPWELVVIEGLEGGRFAIYFKIHHALVDGYTGAKMLARSLSEHPDEPDQQLMISKAGPAREPRSGAKPTTSLESLFEALVAQLGNSRDVMQAVKNVRIARLAKDEHLASPLSTPRSTLNVKISRNRRFATQQFGLDRLRAVAKHYRGTLNDVVLALCAAGLRRLLAEQGTLPAQPLTAFLPVNLRPKDDPGGGNSIGAILVSLATHEEDGIERMKLIVGSSTAAKTQMQSLTKAGMVQYSAVMMSPMLLGQIPGAVSRVRPAFNLCISNVPGPEKPLYFRGARLEANYPVSIPFHGYALNITVSSYAGTLNFGFIGCRDAVPSLQKLAVYAADALRELEGPMPASERVADPEPAAVVAPKAPAKKPAAKKAKA